MSTKEPSPNLSFSVEDAACSTDLMFNAWMRLQSQVNDIANRYVGWRNDESTRRHIKSTLLAQCSDIIDCLKCSKDDFDVVCSNRKRDKLAEKCNSYEEYKMKYVIVHGDLPVTTEREFWEMHDPYNKFKLNIDVKLTPMNTDEAQICKIKIKGKQTQ